MGGHGGDPTRSCTEGAHGFLKEFFDDDKRIRTGKNGESMELDEIMDRLHSLSDPEAVKGMARYGINSTNNLGVSVHTLRRIAKEVGKDHTLALQLWDTGIHDARMLANLIADPDQVTEELMERWVLDLDSWDVCDICCSNLLDRTPFAYDKAYQWSEREEEFVKRAGFVIMAALSVHDKKADDEAFVKFFPVIVRESWDDRNYVKKAVNWTLRQIGKRNLALNAKAVKLAEELAAKEERSARWIGKDALRELTSEKVRERLGKKEEKERKKEAKEKQKRERSRKEKKGWNES